MSQMNGEVWVITLIGKEWRNVSSSTRSIVVGEFCKQKECIPIVLLVVAEYVQVLLYSLVSLFCLTVTYGMITRSEVQIHV